MLSKNFLSPVVLAASEQLVDFHIPVLAIAPLLGPGQFLDPDDSLVMPTSCDPTVPFEAFLHMLDK